jgi:hypothetical protein
MPWLNDRATPTREELLKTGPGQLYLKSWLANRLAVGLLGTVMPIILIAGDASLFAETHFPRTSLSAYFFSGLSVVFTGTLCVTGVFLITYMAPHRNWDNVISAAAGCLAICVAVFPTWPDEANVPTPIQSKLGHHAVELLHTGSATLFIALLAVMSWRFARREGDRGNYKLAKVHRVCAAVMLITAVVAFAGKLLGIKQFGEWSSLLIVELVCTYAFGISWLLKGLELSKSLIRLGVTGNAQFLLPADTATATNPLVPAGTPQTDP